MADEGFIPSPEDVWGPSVSFEPVPGSTWTPGIGPTDTGSFDPPPPGTFLGLTADKWAGGLKDIGEGLKGAGTPAGAGAARPVNPNTSQATLSRGQGGGLATLLQILAARANAFQQAARSGAVPTPTRPGGGLLGL